MEVNMKKVMHDLYYSEMMFNHLKEWRNGVGINHIINPDGEKIVYTLAVREGTESGAAWPDLKLVGKAKLLDY
jgi:hypothetical protein